MSRVHQMEKEFTEEVSVLLRLLGQLSYIRIDSNCMIFKLNSLNSKD